jgi:crotonobetainyl-CoA:carnitine CoA-transferase CaiB-like acyl-CoA transferase
VWVRENIVEFPNPLGGILSMVGIVPKLSATPGQIETAGPVTPGAHNEEIYCGRLGLSRDDLAALGEKGIV